MFWCKKENTELALGHMESVLKLWALSRLITAFRLYKCHFRPHSSGGEKYGGRNTRLTRYSKNTQSVLNRTGIQTGLTQHPKSLTATLHNMSRCRTEDMKEGNGGFICIHFLNSFKLSIKKILSWEKNSNFNLYSEPFFELLTYYDINYLWQTWIIFTLHINRASTYSDQWASDANTIKIQSL